MISLRDVQKVENVKPYPAWIALPFCLIGLPAIVVGAIVGLVWQWLCVGWALGWWSSIRFEAYIEKHRKAKHPPTGDERG